MPADHKMEQMAPDMTYVGCVERGSMAKAFVLTHVTAGGDMKQRGVNAYTQCPRACGADDPVGVDEYDERDREQRHLGEMESGRHIRTAAALNQQVGDEPHAIQKHPNRQPTPNRQAVAQKGVANPDREDLRT